MIFGGSISAQQDTVRIYLRPNVTKTSIQLRWTAGSPDAWYYTNKNGVTIERYTLMRGEAILDNPEKVVLTSTPLKPPVLNDWQHIAQTDMYAAIIAQALYGDDFEVSGGRKGIGEIIALSQEQEQRYAMSMYAADLSYQAALFAGWGYEDKTAVQGERYLYRVIPVNKDNKKHTEMASCYIGLDDYQELPQPLELDALFGNGSALITWNYQILLNYYNTYHIERSEDGKDFRRLNKSPLTNVTGGDRIFYTDSIQNDKTYYYRVIGLTPFGEESPVSDTIQGQGQSKLVHIPHITRVTPYDDGSVNIEWEFNEEGNGEIKHFRLERGDTDKGPYETIEDNISSDKRNTVYQEPLPANYLRIAAIPKREAEEPTYSFPRLLQMADSIPPSTPTGLMGEIDSLGIVRLTWDANAEADLLGYRIFKGQTAGEELIPLNDIAVRTNEFADTVSLYNLNAKAYYAVTALDQRYNQSEQSKTITLLKPLKVKPAPPYISGCEATDKGIILEWIPGNDETITSYSVWRREGENEEERMIATIENASIVNYTDSTVLSNTNYIYRIRSINSGKMESEPSPSAYAKSMVGESTSLIKKFSAKRGNKGVTLKWELSSREIQSISIYRKEAGASSILLKEITDIWTDEILDDKAKRNTTYEYTLVIKDIQGKQTHAQTKVN
ncbi:hypothetical protein D0T56_15265 [Dysgonomonas sp. 520]|nr:hypothetical protein [Dysgonomonas sp. 520]